MIRLRGLDHVALRVADLDEAATRWALQFGLTEHQRRDDRIRLACDDEPYSLELIAGEPAGLDHVAWQLAAGCSLEQAREHLETCGVATTEAEGAVCCADAEGNGICLVRYKEPDSRRVPHARPAGLLRPGHPRKLGHVNFLTGALEEQLRFYTEVLGMRVTDWLGDGGVWFHVNTDHHVMALIDKGAPHFHHFAFDVVDIGQMRDMLDHLGRHGRWLGWGPVRHGVGGNIAAYVRIVEESCFVELYCDMEQLQSDHRPRRWPDNRYSSNTWGPLPPRSYFRFDEAAVASEQREPRSPRNSAMTLQGYTIPRTPSGRAGLVPPPPWHYVADFLVVDFHADPDAAVSLLPEGLDPHPDPGRCAAVFADWQSISEAGDELVDPVRSHYREFYLVVNALLDGDEVTTCPFIWVDQDFALARGWIQGFPKKLGEVWMTRAYALQCKAAPGIATWVPLRRHVLGSRAPDSPRTGHAGAAERAGLASHRAADRQRPPLPAAGRRPS